MKRDDWIYFQGILYSFDFHSLKISSNKNSYEISNRNSSRRISKGCFETF